MARLLARLHRLVETIRVGLCKQNEFEFSAPWNRRRGRCG